MTEEEVTALKVQRDFQPVTFTLDGETPFEFQPIELKLPKPEDAIVEDVSWTEKQIKPQPVTMTMSAHTPQEFQPVDLKLPMPDDVREEHITPTEVQRDFQSITLTLDGQTAQPVELKIPKPKDRPDEKLKTTEKYVKPESQPVTLTLDGKTPFEFQPVELTFPKQEDVRSQPRFVQPLSDVVISQGNTVMLECRFTGKPTPVVTWYKDGKVIFEDAKHHTEIRPGNLCVLTIRGVDYEDEGSYRCTATNAVGQDSTTASFKITMEGLPPEFTNELNDMKVKSGNDIILSVSYVGKPEPNISWFVDNDKITEDDGITIETKPGQSSLFLDGFTKADCGSYRCEISNTFGQATTSAQLSLIEERIKGEAPKFVKRLDNITVIEGDAVQLTVIVAGTPKPNVQWLFDNNAVEESNRVYEVLQGDKHVLHIERTQLDDEAEYKCVAKNDHGTTECSCELLVDEKSIKPEFVMELKDVKVIEGEDVKFTIEVSGSPEPEISWFKNNILIEADSKHEIGREKDLFFLNIHKCDLRDSSEVKCTARNAAGEVSSIANLVVDVKPKPVTEEVTFTVAPKDEHPVEMTFSLPSEEKLAPTFIQQLENKEVMEGTRVDLEVEVTGKPKPNVNWLKDGQPLKSNNNIRIASNNQIHTLCIIKATTDDEAEYMCIAKNSVGEISCTSEVLVEEEIRAPEFKTRPKNIRVTEGETAQLEAVVSGLPQPDIEWLKDGKTIQPSHRFKLDFGENRSVLTIVDAKLTDEGDYTCMLSNKAGKDSCQVELLVEESVIPPEFIRKMSTIELSEGDLAQFDVRVSGRPVPDVQWFKDDVPIHDSERTEIRSDDDHRSLVIKDCVGGDAGRYRCTAVNEAGQTSCFGELVVAQTFVQPYFLDEGPVVPPEVEVDGDITLEARVAGHPTPKVHWEKDNIPIKESDHFQPVGIGERYTLTIRGANPEDSGIYTCIAENDAGIAKRTYTIDIQGKLTIFFFSDYAYSYFTCMSNGWKLCYLIQIN